MRRAVVDLASTRPAWRAPSETVEAIRRAFGPGWAVAEIREAVVSDGDGSGASDEAVRAARGAEVYVGWGVSPGVVEAGMGTLRWAHTAAGGVGGSLAPALRVTGAALTNSRGIYAEPVADWAVAAIAYCVRGFHAAVAAQRERRWAKDVFTGGTVPVSEFRDVRVGVVGLGGIGRAIARRCAALGMEVHGLRRRAGGRRPAGVAWVGTATDLRRLARRSDVLVLAAPHTAETEAVVDAGVLSALPRGAFVINVSRGALLDEAALLAQLEAGQVGGCVLDVFASEPLPADHLFWTHPRVLITPHVSGVTRRFWERQTALIVENIGRYLNGRRLKNLVDPGAGY